MYLLARSMVGQRGVALFAGLVPLTADMHLASLDARLEYAFLGLQAILLLVLQRALDPRRHAAWSLGVGAVLLLLLLQSGYQLVFGLLATGFLACTTLLTVRRAAAPETLRRVALIAIVSIGFVLPQVVNILVTTRSSGLVVDLRFFASLYDPDVLHYLLPAPQSLISDIFADSSLAHSAVWSKKLDVEKQVTLPLTVVALLIVLLRTRTTAAARWLGLFALCATLSLGTNITFADRRLLPDTLARFMPFSLLTGLPGLEFVRVSGRFMLLGYIVLGVCSALGLRWLTLAYPRRSNTLVALSIATLLLETWPWPWLVHPLPSVPAFYSALEGEETRYGLLDLPVTVRPDEGVVEHSSVYQL
jgi:hypothetical protein